MGAVGRLVGEAPGDGGFGAGTWLTSGKQAACPRQTAPEVCSQREGAAGGRVRQPVGSAVGAKPTGPGIICGASFPL